jgi:hypothetical protein
MLLGGYFARFTQLLLTSPCSMMKIFTSGKVVQDKGLIYVPFFNPVAFFFFGECFARKHALSMHFLGTLLNLPILIVSITENERSKHYCTWKNQ